jgi:ankyrin repeat protein
MSEFVEAIRKGDAARVRELIDDDPSLLKREGPGPVLLALYNGQRAIAEMLASRMPDRTVHEAAALGDAEGVRSMLQRDPSLVRTFSADGFALLGFGTFFGQPAVDRVVLEFSPDVNAQAKNAQKVGAVHAAAAVQNHELLRAFLERGANPNAKQQGDYTPLHTTAGRGDIEMAKLLLEFGADAHAVTADGKSVLDVARDHDKKDFVDWFEKRG